MGAGRTTDLYKICRNTPVLSNLTSSTPDRIPTARTITPYIECVQSCHLVIIQLKIENLEVLDLKTELLSVMYLQRAFYRRLTYSTWRITLYDRYEAVLDGPA